MATGESLHAAEALDRKRLALSLAGAVLVSSVGFALILVLIAELPHMLLTSKGEPIPMVAALLPIFSGTFMRVLLPTLPILVAFPAILVAMRKRCSASTDRASKF